MRGGESTRVLELALVDGVPSAQALMSSRMSETVTLFWSNVRGTLIVSDLRWEVDSALRDVAGVTGRGKGKRRGLRGVIRCADSQGWWNGHALRECGV